MVLALASDTWTAIGTLSLAGITAVAVVVGIVLALLEGRRDDRKRAEDRAAAERRRQEERGEAERRAAKERLDREDFEARQVVMEEMPVPKGNEFSRLVIVSWPLIYPVKQVEVYIASEQNSGGLGVRSCGHAGGDPYVRRDRRCQEFRVERMDDRREKPIIKFVDWHGNLYYQYRGYTRRFPQSTDFGTAVARLDEFIRTGPKPD
jgi:hypothetical protein